ncbi:MAG: DUF2946 family protein [Pseudomonadota bacterium]|uniref:hypothetical protein n=1 Tax=Roseixanthobacter finlandensis TaxID=3119922 RepID=UPI0037270E91
MRTTQTWLRPGFALAMAYVFVLQTVLALSLSTAHTTRAALAADPTQILCLASHDDGSDSGGTAGGEHPTSGKTVPVASCALCAFAGTGFTPPALADFVPLDRAFLRVTNATERAFALRSPAPTPRLSQGPPRTA